ncbi:MAG TPA: hypothetical protein VHE35_02550 [Kofleriaceae bacterium]|nr:hypothetical protein [Kofleriaceae bacterium]
MTRSFELKLITRDGIPQALEKAERYRLLNDPAQAESICRDILAVDADHQDTLRTLVLALTDQFTSGHAHAGAQAARELVRRLRDEYDRAYYTGIVLEREARAFLSRPGAVPSAAYDGFRAAMDWYEQAEHLRPPGSVDALLRWNSCVRTITAEHLEPSAAPGDEREQPLE